MGTGKTSAPVSRINYAVFTAQDAPGFQAGIFRGSQGRYYKRCRQVIDKDGIVVGIFDPAAPYGDTYSKPYLVLRFFEI